MQLIKYYGGEGGIRTHGTLARTPVFKTGTFGHSVTSPDAQIVVVWLMVRLCDIHKAFSSLNFTPETKKGALKLPSLNYA